MEEYELPIFLEGKVLKEKYVKWLKSKASTISRNDKKKKINLNYSSEEYRSKIHDAVMECKGSDFYTKEPLDWNKISKYNDEESKKYKREYKKQFYYLPTVDHEWENGSKDCVFHICSWKTNDCKNDLNHEELIAFCKTIIKNSNHANYIF